MRRTLLVLAMTAALAAQESRPSTRVLGRDDTAFAFALRRSGHLDLAAAMARTILTLQPATASPRLCEILGEAWVVQVAAAPPAAVDALRQQGQAEILAWRAQLSQAMESPERGDDSWVLTSAFVRPRLSCFAAQLSPQRSRKREELLERSLLETEFSACEGDWSVDLMWQWLDCAHCNVELGKPQDAEARLQGVLQEMESRNSVEALELTAEAHALRFQFAGGDPGALPQCLAGQPQRIVAALQWGQGERALARALRDPGRSALALRLFAAVAQVTTDDDQAWWQARHAELLTLLDRSERDAARAALAGIQRPEKAARFGLDAAFAELRRQLRP